jgi:hypothetical protein
MNVGNVHHHADRHAEALASYRRARRLLSKAGTPTDLASCAYNTANILASLDRTAEARELLIHALGAYGDEGVEALAAQSEYALAGLDVLEGQLDAALPRLARVRARAEALGDVPGVAHADLDMADALLRLNRPADARAAAERARAHFSREGQALEVAKVDASCASASLQEGRARAAAKLFRAAARQAHRADNAVVAAWHEVGLATALADAGRTAEAMARARDAASVFSRRRLWSRQARALAVAAEAARRGDLARRARPWALEALRLAGAARDARVELAALLVLARLEEAAGRGEEAHAWLLRADQCVERLRLGVTTEESQLAFAIDKSEVYEALVTNRLRVGTRRAVRQALEYAERGKARALAERLSRGGVAVARLAGGAAPKVLRRLRQVERQLAVAEARLQDPQRAPGLRSAAARQLDALMAARARALRDVAKVDAERGSLLGATTPRLDVRAFGPGEIVLEHVVAGEALHLFVIEDGDVEVIADLASTAEVRDAVDLLRFHLGKGALGAPHDPAVGRFAQAALRGHLARLEDMLLARTWDRLQDKLVRIVPHGVLHGMPFHALERDGVALVDRAVVAYAPSLAVMQLLASRKAMASTAPLVLGVPDHAAPEIEAEVTAVTERLGSGRVFRGATATTEALRLSEERPSVLHVACHGFFSAREGAASGLRLGDAWVTLADIYGLQATGDLVVLSGCETGRGTVHAGDEWVGLVRGFLVAGARGVVASLWEVHDQSTAELMSDLYSHLSVGKPVAQALALAQRRARMADPNPLRWAPFALVGDPHARLAVRKAA